MTFGPQGWIADSAAVTAAARHLESQGQLVMAADARPDLVGHWPRLVQRGITAVLPYASEAAVLGAFQPANRQRRGTCVGQAIERALRDGLLYDIHRGGEIARPAAIAFELIYAGARTIVRRGQLGSGDGAVVADAAVFVHDYGTIARGVYGPYDLTQPREDLAVAWGAPRAVIPPELLAAAQAHKCRAFLCPDFERACDCLAAGYCLAIGTNRIHGAHRDADGCCQYSGPGAHCTELCGVFLARSWDGDPHTIYDHTGLVDQQSWGDYPTGPAILKYFGGEAALRQGAFGVLAAEGRAMFRASGDTWAFQLEQHYR
jgi:hypothetical protein